MGTFEFNKEAEILIYGYGKVGQNLHQRLVGQGYQVIGIIDKNADKLTPVDNCCFIKPKELDSKSTGNIIILTFQNILEHERVVKILVAKGMKKIVYLNRSRPETYQICFRIYNQLINDKNINDFEFPLANIEFESKCRNSYIEEVESVIIDVPATLIFTSLESSPWRDVNIAASKEYNALFDVLLHGRYNSSKDFKIYCDVLCGSDRTLKDYLEDRVLLFKMMQVEYMNNGLSFFRNAPSTAQWNRRKGYFNLTDGHHRTSFLVNNHVYTIPIRISKEDYKYYYNSVITEKCRVYIEKIHIENTYTPIYHPAFSVIDYSVEKVGGLAAVAFYKFFAGKGVNNMRVFDINSNLSYFSQIFARMGATQIISIEPRKDLFELAILLNQLHYTETIEMHNDTIQDMDVKDSYDIVIMANDLAPDFYSEDTGEKTLKKMDKLSSMYFIKRSGSDICMEKKYILENSSFKMYYRLSVEIINGEVSEIGIYEK